MANISIEHEELERAAAADELVHALELDPEERGLIYPETRKEFLQHLSTEEFLDMLTTANGIMRNLPTEEHGFDGDGSTLPLLSMPHDEDKLPLLSNSFEKVQRYVAEQDTYVDADRVMAVAGMALEAAIIHTHPFADGNGRTGRFIGALFMDGTEDINRFKKQVASSKYHQTHFPPAVAKMGTEQEASVELPMLDIMDARFKDSDLVNCDQLEQTEKEELLALLNDSEIDNVIDASFGNILTTAAEQLGTKQPTIRDLASFITSQHIKDIADNLRSIKRSRVELTVDKILSDQEYQDKLISAIKARRAKVA